METENDCEINRARDAIQMIQTLQTMIDVSAERLKGLRTQCLTSAELTQQEIRTLEGKLVKHFSKQLVIKAKFGEELQKELSNVPSLELWLRVVGLGPESIVTICSRVTSLETLREKSDHELGTLMPLARDEEVRRLCRAMQRLRSYTDALARGESVCEMPLYWDSWERQRATRSRGSTASDIKEEGRKYGTPVGKRRPNKQLPAPAASLPTSRSHESQLAGKPDTSDLSDNSQSSAVNTSETSPPSTPQDRNNYHATRPHHNNTWWQGGVAPISPMSPGSQTGPQSTTGSLSTSGPQSTGGSRSGGCMAHDIAHRFRKSFSVLMPTCDYCEKQIFGNGLKCKECKFKCHRECERKVPPSCGLPPEFVNAFRETVHKDGKYTGNFYPARASFLGSLRPKRKKPDSIQNHIGLYNNRDSSSTTSSCNSSAPSSPAPPPAAVSAAAIIATNNNNHFHFPEVKPAISSANHTPVQSPARITNNVVKEKEDLTCSVRSDSSVGVSLSGSASTDSGGARADSLDKGDPRWPRQNSLSMKEWDIPYSELQLFEVLGTGRFGTVYRGSWHGAVAVKLLHLPTDHQLDTFKHEVATFRKTRHENLVLFMGACMKPPKLCIVTSLCCGMTLHQLIHLRRDKFTPNKSVIVAQQISQGMGYLHARGIIHKDLKTKNIFLENGKVVITDFGLFSVTKLCFANNARGDSLGIPAGWLCYLAPELVRALRPHASLHLPFSKYTDVYAFGTVVYELLCGEWPFSGERAEAVIWQVGSGVKQSLAALHASPDMKEIVSQCWAYRERERPTFPALLASVEKLPRKRLARSPSHPLHLSRSADTLL